jgi:Flp pilus assembly protein TadD
MKLSKLCPEDPIVHYNLACSYSLMGEMDDAFASLRKSVERGYDDVQYLNTDPDLRTLRSDPRYEDILEFIAARQNEHK